MVSDHGSSQARQLYEEALRRDPENADAQKSRVRLEDLIRKIRRRGNAVDWMEPPPGLFGP